MLSEVERLVAGCSSYHRWRCGERIPWELDRGLRMLDKVMRRGNVYASEGFTVLIGILVLCIVALCLTLPGRKVSGQNPKAQTSEQAYNPYPPIWMRK